MIYLTVRTSPIKEGSLETINKFLDFLELDLGLESTDLKWNPEKTLIKVILNRKKQLLRVESELRSLFNVEIEWTVYDDDIPERYVAQLLITDGEKRMLTTYLLVLFPEDYIWTH